MLDDAPSVPAYAAGVPLQLLVTFFCQSACKDQGVGKASRSTWESFAPTGDTTLFVTCLRCGGVQYDSFNWVPL